jgi:hypothetical protein
VPTASSMVFASLVLNGEKEIGGTISADEKTFYLDRLNSMLESWQLERLLCTQVVQESFSLSVSTGSYTIGSNGVFSTERPTRLVDPCFIRDTNSIDTPLKLIPVDSYGSIDNKSQNIGYPRFLYYDHGFSATSTATIQLYPVPQANLTLFINSIKPLQNFSTISHPALLPPGYQRTIEYNFAIEIAGGFTSVAPEVARIAMESKKAIKVQNLPDSILRLDFAVRRPNIIEG